MPTQTRLTLSLTILDSGCLISCDGNTKLRVEIVIGNGGRFSGHGVHSPGYIRIRNEQKYSIVIIITLNARTN